MRPVNADFDAVVVGAGPAGLAAAARLRSLGATVAVLEARRRAGGRTLTVQHRGRAADLGATWMDNAGRNPLVALGGGRDAFPRFTPRHAAPCGARARRCAEAWISDALVRRADLPGADCSALAALEERPGVPEELVPWLPSAAAAMIPMLLSADLRDVGCRDARENALDGDDLWVEGGMGAWVQRNLVPAAGPVALDWPVTRIARGGPGGRVEISGPRGRLTGAACVVAVPAAVLASGAVGLVLPVAHQEALQALPTGHLAKVSFACSAPELAELGPDSVIERRVGEHGEPAMFFVANAGGTDMCLGYVGGSAAAALSAQGRGGAPFEDFARSELVRAAGGRAAAWLPAGASVMHDWSADPRALGSYTYGIPGCGDARDVLGEAMDDGRLVLASEALARTQAGTVHGAWMSGRRAADVAWAAIRGLPAAA